MIGKKNSRIIISREIGWWTSGGKTLKTRPRQPPSPPHTLVMDNLVAWIFIVVLHNFLQKHMGWNHLKYFNNSQDSDTDVLLHREMCRQARRSVCCHFDVVCLQGDSGVPSEWHSKVVLEENGMLIQNRISNHRTAGSVLILKTAMLSTFTWLVRF